MSTIRLMPRWAGRPDSDWYPWLGREVADRWPKWAVEVLGLPNPDAPVIEQCLGSLDARFGEALDGLRSDVLIGHSVGAQVWMRWLATLEAEPGQPVVDQLICVAGWWTVDEPWPALRPWIDTPIDLPRVRAAAREITVVMGERDPFTRDFRTNRSNWEQRLDARVIVVPEAGHFNAAREPALIDVLEECLD